MHQKQTTREISMNKVIVLALLLPTITVAKSPFDGTWKMRVDSVQVSGKPDVYEISNGMYDCKSCAPPFKIKADGTDQPVADHAYLDHESVKILNASAIEITDKKAGKVMTKMTMTASADGSKFTCKFTNYTGKEPFSGTFTEKRVAPGAAGAHAMSGSWMQDSLADMSDVARTLTLQSTPSGLKMTWNGQTTDAKFDGKEYPSVGDPGKTMVTLKKVSDTQIEETDRRQGKVFDVIVFSVAPDGKTINSEDTDPVHGTKTSSVFEKQP
jgi:hypothetical protein